VVCDCSSMEEYHRMVIGDWRIQLFSEEEIFCAPILFHVDFARQTNGIGAAICCGIYDH
jgi:hypothetical protein